MTTRPRPALHTLAAGALLFTPLCPLPALAADASPWSLRVGPAAVRFDASATVAVAGAKVPGGDVRVSDNNALALAVGYALDERWTLRLAVGVPPTTTLRTGGSLNALVPPLSGRLGRATYGPAVLSATWSPGIVGPFRPYAGAGINYTHVFSTDDGDIGGLKVKSAFGSALQLGVELPIDRSWSLFLDARKVFVKTTARGSVPALGGPAAKADVTLDPLIVHLGAAWRF